MRFDFIIIGSGVSGGRMAGHLVDAGAKVLLLEAGRPFDSKSFPTHELDMNAQMFWGGGTEMSKDGCIGLMRGKCLGGTSVLSRAIFDRFDEDAFQDWKDRSEVPFFRKKEMTPYYEKAEASICIQKIPTEFQNENAKRFTRALDALEYYWKPVQRGQSNCKLEKGSDCIVCSGGCSRNSKQSSLLNNIYPAKEKGLQIETEIEVQCVSEKSDHVEVAAVRRGSLLQYHASKIILAAGSIGNSKILLKSNLQKKLPAIGKYFTCHPQFMTFALFDETIDSHKGAFLSVQTEDAKLRRMGLKLENVATRPIHTSLLLPTIRQKNLEFMKKYRNYSSIEIGVRDEPNGKISLDSGGDVILEKSLTHQDRSRIKNGLHFVNELFQTINSKKIIHSTRGIGQHLMGGCSIGIHEKKSVTNPDFQLYHHKRIYLSDSSIFPSAPGINPSLTIMALTDMAFEKIERDFR